MTFEIPEWMEQARCAEVDPALFYPKRGGSAREAKAICAGCEVREQCLAFALEYESHQHAGADTRAPHGVWGGFTERERRRMLRDGQVA